MVYEEFEKQLNLIEKDIEGKARSFHIAGMGIKDVEQELRIHLMNKFDLWDKEKSSFRTWAVRVMRNRLTNMARDNGKENNIVYASKLQEAYEDKHDDEDGHLNIYEEVIASDNGDSAKNILVQSDNETILDAVECLPERQKNVVKLHIYEDWTFKEIADELEISERCAYREWNKAKNVLGVRLQDFAI